MICPSSSKDGVVFQIQSFSGIERKQPHRNRKHLKRPSCSSMFDDQPLKNRRTVPKLATDDDDIGGVVQNKVLQQHIIIQQDFCKDSTSPAPPLLLSTTTVTLAITNTTIPVYYHPLCSSPIPIRKRTKEEDNTEYI